MKSERRTTYADKGRYHESTHDVRRYDDGRTQKNRGGRRTKFLCQTTCEICWLGG